MSNNTFNNCQNFVCIFVNISIISVSFILIFADKFFDNFVCSFLLNLFAVFSNLHKNNERLISGIFIWFIILKFITIELEISNALVDEKHDLHKAKLFKQGMQ